MTDQDTTRQPGQPPLPGQPAGFDPIGLARRLLRGGRTASLATLEAGTGAPFVTLVTVATMPDGAPILLLSRIAPHTANALADARVSLLVGETGKGDPLAHPRLTLSGRLVALDDPAAARARFLARHPKARLYVDFPDFGFYRLDIEAGHLNGGFARAARLSPGELFTDLAGAEELVSAEAGAVEHMNADHADATRLYATRLLGRRDGAWRIAGIDPEGCDLVLDDESARLPFPERVETGVALRMALKRLADAARLAA